ncbi:MAG: hypothetical protein KDD94_08865, partial [Calditrichaeota bacterium]|nr:hypothetical protein [Calditrichota bacterium]
PDTTGRYFAVKAENEQFYLVHITDFDGESILDERFSEEPVFYFNGINLFYLQSGRFYRYQYKKQEFLRQMPSSRSTDLAVSKSGYYWIEHSNRSRIFYRNFSKVSDSLVFQYNEVRDIRYLTVDWNDVNLFFQHTDNSNSRLLRIDVVKD